MKTTRDGEPDNEEAEIVATRCKGEVGDVEDVAGVKWTGAPEELRVASPTSLTPRILESMYAAAGTKGGPNGEIAKVGGDG